MEDISEMERADVLTESNELSAMMFRLKKKLTGGRRPPMVAKGLTLIELMISTALVAVLTGVVVYVFRAILLSWAGAEGRAGINVTLGRAVEEMRRDVISSRSVASGTNNEVRFTASDNANQIYYLYNAADGYPPRFNQATYILKKTALSGALTNGTFTYGNGDIILTDVLPPPVSDLSFSSNLVVIDLSSMCSDETARLRTQVKPRNSGL